MRIEKVMERVYDRKRMQTAWQQVRRNAGAAGIDNVTTEGFEKQEQKYLELACEKLESGEERFKPAKRKVIPKPGTTKERKLGLPVVLDRIVSQSINLALTDIFDPSFTESNFGFRKGKGQHQAVGYMRHIIGEGYEWCVSIDLKSFFDEIPHGLIFKLLRRKIKDERLITLIARALKAGVIIDGKFEKTTKGVPQGSPLSPILSNIVLNELDHELERRGHKYVRWADDFLIFVKSERAGKRVKEGITRYLEEELGLAINEEKSKIVISHKAEFLSFQILKGKIRISTKSKKRFKEKIRELTKRNNPVSMYKIIQKLNEYLRGWIGYFRIQEFHRPIEELDGFIRSRLRSMQLKKWKKPKKFQRMMITQGMNPKEAKETWVNMRKWKSALRREVKFTLNLNWFRRLGLISLVNYTQRNLEFGFSY